MAIIRPYEQQTNSPSGEIGVRASAADFGGASAQGMQQFGETMQNAAIMIDRQEQQREVADAQVKMEQAESMFAIRAEELKKSATPDQPTSPLLAKEMNEYFTGMMSEYKHKGSQQYIQMHASNMTQKFFGAQMNFDVDYQAKYTQNLRTTAFDEQTKKVGLNPDLYDETVARNMETLESGTGIADNRGNPAVKEALRAVFQQQKERLAQAAGLSVINDPARRAVWAGITDAVGKAIAPAEQVAMAIFGQESSSGKADTSQVGPKGALGPMQITKDTWDTFVNRGVIPKDYKWDNPEQNKDAGFKIVNYYHKQYGGDVEKIAAAYYGGEGAINKDGTINRERRPAGRPQDPSIGEYIQQVSARGGFQKEIPQDAKFDIESAPSWFKDMDFEKQVQFLNQVQQRSNQEARIKNQELKLVQQDHLALLEAGKPVVNKLQPSQFATPQEYMQYKIQMDAGETALAAARMPPNEAMKVVETLRPKEASLAEPGRYAMEQKAFETAQKVVVENIKNREKDPAQMAMNEGYSGDKPMVPFERFDEQELTNNLKTRIAQMTAHSSETGAPKLYLTATEAKGVAATVAHRDPAGQIAYMKHLASMTSKEEYETFSKQVWGNDASMYGAGALLRLPSGTSIGGKTSDDMAMSILLGKQAMAMASDEKVKAIMPSAGDVRELVGKRLAGMTMNERDLGAISDTVAAYYIGESMKKNRTQSTYDLKGDKNNSNVTTFNNAMDEIVKTAAIGGTRTLIPLTYNATQFQNDVAKKVGEKEPKLQGYSVTPVGEGMRYKVSVGGMEKFEIDLSEPSLPVTSAKQTSTDSHRQATPAPKGPLSYMTGDRSDSPWKKPNA